ncbi:hypothetical protein DFAR_1560005 [Desulfarculales bacterium]
MQPFWGKGAHHVRLELGMLLAARLSTTNCATWHNPAAGETRNSGPVYPGSQKRKVVQEVGISIARASAWTASRARTACAISRHARMSAPIRRAKSRYSATTSVTP